MARLLLPDDDNPLQWDYTIMKARVHVSFKPTVLDPQGQTIQSALNGLGHRSIAAVRQGKFFDIEIQPGAAREDAAREMDQIARDVLSNPVMEDYQVEFLD
jgi:phosphoribosylformylglycinamidine synthase